MIKLVLEKRSKTYIKPVFDKKLPDEVKPYKRNKLFEAKSGEVLDLLEPNRKGNIYLGLGKASKLDNEELRLAGFKLGKALVNLKVKDAVLDLRGLDKKDEVIFHLVEGLLTSNYKFDLYKSDKKEDKVLELGVMGEKGLEAKIEEATKLVDSVFVARNLVNYPAIDLYPETYAQKIEDLFKDTSVEVEIFDEVAIHEMGMKALEAVAIGSDNPPRFVVMRYMPLKDEKEHITFVGKGLTYDSGGYAIKSANGMATMHSDMGGSAAVIGAIKAISDNELPINVVAVTALAENMISGRAYKNGDIISSMKGLTIEVGNTDAEGRVTMADSLYYSATKLNTTKIVELSTLTGACVVALGSGIVGAVSNNDRFYNQVHKAGLAAGELNWRFPVTEELKNMVKGKQGDLKNSIRGGAGAITAGIFLTHFVEDKPYVHLDIAGPAHLSSAKKYYTQGGTGVGVRTLYELAKLEIK